VLRGCTTAEQAADLLPEDETLLRSTREHFLVHVSPEEFTRRTQDPEVQPFLKLLEREQDFGLTLLRAMENGTIRRVAIHGDTKLDNFLFTRESNQVKALVDLDTIMPHTWLADWGDMVRSLANVAGEKEEDLSKVQLDTEIFEAVARGFLSTAQSTTGAEVELMVQAVEIIALELGLRFLTDHLRGDSYFKLSSTDPPGLNRTRGMVQLTLFERIREKESWAEECIGRLRNQR
jgi:hypothetical protein